MAQITVGMVNKGMAIDPLRQHQSLPIAKPSKNGHLSNDSHHLSTFAPIPILGPPKHGVWVDGFIYRTAIFRFF